MPDVRVHLPRSKNICYTNSSPTNVPTRQEMEAMRTHMSGQINVEVDAKPQQDLNKIMDEIREQYESLAAKNHKELQTWFDAKVRKYYLRQQKSLHVFG